MEISTIASYYLLYQNLRNETSEKETVTKESFWQEDEWTEDDCSAATRLLQASALKCRSNEPPPLEEDSWNAFYQKNEAKFFKDRHYLLELLPATGGTLVELGCGVGNALWPLLERPEWTQVFGLDVSPVAIELLQKDTRYLQVKDRLHAQVFNLSQEGQLFPLAGVADVTLLWFCLSAVANRTVAANYVIQALKPGGILLFRDYGRYDHAQLQLSQQRNRLLDGNAFYRKQDQTCCYYFALEDLRELFASLEVLELQYLARVYRNRATGVSRRRVWVEGRFRKPSTVLLDIN